ncbi:MAG: hypothetical protein II295_10870 [Akkermansia sp.]|nr:hypothetical protein [Akkermansia sp.]
MKYQTLSLALAALVALTPAFAQSSRGARGARPARGAATAPAEAQAPATGVRFVICSASGAKLPSPLFYNAGKDKAGKPTFKKVTISGRIPTNRIRPEGGVINFYDKDPSPAPSVEAGKKPAAAAPVELPPPALSISVPQNAGSKSLCIVIPGDKPSNAKTFFIDEADFPTKGVHLINLSSSPVTVYTSKTNSLENAKGEKVGPYHKGKGINADNSWHYTRGENGDQVSFRITTRQVKQDKQTGKKTTTESNVRMGKFLVSERQSQINVIVKDGNRDALKLISIQMSNN